MSDVDQSDAARAGRLYPSTATPAATPSAPASLLGSDEPTSEETPAEPRSTTPQHIQAERDADQGRRMFGTGLEGVLPDGSIDGADVAELREVLTDLGASSADAADFRVLAQQVAREPASLETRAAWRSEALEMMKRDEVSPADFARAQRYIARDPRVAEYLTKSGLECHPDVVRAAISFSKSAANRGLKF
ncbi:MAG TPA: hypothetical protein VFR90_03245 [Methylibium sp.]|uniref:hypothetical protein n=1 Tax=Methylibium sp. TaxID=2067992 RepID=UPI002DB827D0|nr:hypothetical protein [Methylibium sp.]HEU4458116.1 hypothetical protein [Methylibium sp.]